MALPYLRFLAKTLGIPADRLVVSLPEHGNCASTTLPLQLATGRLRSRATGSRCSAWPAESALGVMLAEM